MIRVIIERVIAEGLEEFFEKEIAKMLNTMIEAPGYVSGESMVDLHRPNHYLVVTRWTSEKAWQRWFRSVERQQMLTAITPFLLNDEKLTLLRQLTYHKDNSAI